MKLHAQKQRFDETPQLIDVLAQRRVTSATVRDSSFRAEYRAAHTFRQTVDGCSVVANFVTSAGAGDRAEQAGQPLRLQVAPSLPRPLLKALPCSMSEPRRL